MNLIQHSLRARVPSGAASVDGSATAGHHRLATQEAMGARAANKTPGLYWVHQVATLAAVRVEVHEDSR